MRFSFFARTCCLCVIFLLFAAQSAVAETLSQGWRQHDVGTSDNATRSNVTGTATNNSNGWV
jgi:hypothetical protein